MERRQLHRAYPASNFFNHFSNSTVDCSCSAGHFSVKNVDAFYSTNTLKEFLFMLSIYSVFSVGKVCYELIKIINHHEPNLNVESE